MALRDDEFKAKNFVPDKLDLSFEPSIFPIWRKLLELYAGKDTVPFEYVQSGMNLEDYCFAGPRKAGAWYSDLERAKKVKACKRMVFGLEICADHPTKRLSVLNKLNTPNPVIGIDFHLLPSAGFAPSYFGTRENGYIFNCDGWNKPHPKGGAKIEVMFEGPKSEARVLKDGTLSGFANPVFPHSAVAKRIGQAKDVAVCLEPEKVSADLNKKLSEVIFAHGPGELHFYPIQDLPK
jgi:hypothetical protein